MILEAIFWAICLAPGLIPAYVFLFSDRYNGEDAKMNEGNTKINRTNMKWTVNGTPGEFNTDKEAVYDNAASYLGENVREDFMYYYSNATHDFFKSRVTQQFANPVPKTVPFGSLFAVKQS